MVIEIKVPDIGLEEVEVTEVLVKVGDKIEVEQSLITVEGDKASIEIPAPYAGTVKELKVTTADKVSTDSLIMIIEVEEENVVPSISTSEIEQKVIVSSIQDDISSDLNNNYIESDSHVHAAPTVRRLAYEFGIDLKVIKGTGRKNRILKEDIQSYIKDLVQRAEEVSVIPYNDSKIFSKQWPKADFNKFGVIEEIELSRIKKISGANLSRNWMIIPHVTLFEKSDITELESFRKQQNTEAEKKKLNVKYSILVFIMKALAAALEQMPIFNSSLSENGQKLIIKKYINIGIAVDTPTGLVVPVIKEINKKGIIELSRQLVIITKKAHDNKLIPSDMQGGSFTISSLGSLGTTSFTPIINAPEVAILGISKAIIEPVWDGKEFIPRLMMPMSLSFDHRIIDGADGIRFINVINSFLRDIRLLLM